jgi:hypothetical protein
VLRPSLFHSPKKQFQEKSKKAEKEEDLAKPLIKDGRHQQHCWNHFHGHRRDSRRNWITFVLPDKSEKFTYCKIHVKIVNPFLWNQTAVNFTNMLESISLNKLYKQIFCTFLTRLFSLR